MNSVSRRTYLIASITVIVCAAIMAMAFDGVYAARALQPSIPAAGNQDFYHAIRETPRAVLGFMATDLLFIFGYITVFIGIYDETRSASKSMSIIALCAGISAGLFDLLENSYFITYASQSLYGHKLMAPALPQIYVLASMKWICAYFSLFLYSMLWPRTNAFDWTLSSVMILFPVLGVLSTAIPELLVLRPMPLIVAILLLAWHFLKRENTIP